LFAIPEFMKELLDMDLTDYSEYAATNGRPLEGQVSAAFLVKGKTFPMMKTARLGYWECKDYASTRFFKLAGFNDFIKYLLSFSFSVKMMIYSFEDSMCMLKTS